MRVNLSNHWRINALFSIISSLLTVVGAAAFCIWAQDIESIIYLMLPALVLVAIPSSMLFELRRLFGYSILEQDKVSAYTFRNKPLCTIDTSKPVFYSIFFAQQDTFATYKMIAVSNEPFDCWKSIKKPFLMYYDQSKIIVIPYKDDLIPFLNMEEWHEV